MKRPVFSLFRVAAIAMVASLAGCAQTTGPGGSGSGGGAEVAVGSTFDWKTVSVDWDPEENPVHVDTSFYSYILSATNAYAHGKYGCFGLSGYYNGSIEYDTAWYQHTASGDLAEYQDGSPYVWFTYPFGTTRANVFNWDTNAYDNGQFVKYHVTQTTTYLGPGLLVTDSNVLSTQKVQVLMEVSGSRGNETLHAFDTVIASYSPVLGMIVATEEGTASDYFEKGLPDHDTYHRSSKLVHYNLAK